MTNLSKISSKDLQAELGRRSEEKRKRDYAEICEKFPCPECNGNPREISTDATEEHRFAPRDDEGRPMLYMPYEMGVTGGLTYQTTVTCENGHVWYPEPVIKWFDKP